MAITLSVLDLRSVHNNKMLSYRRETALQGALVFSKSRDWNWETIFYGQGPSSTTVI